MQHRAAKQRTDVLQCLTLHCRVSLSTAKLTTQSAVKHTKMILNTVMYKQSLKCAIQNKAVTQSLCLAQQWLQTIYIQKKTIYIQQKTITQKAASQNSIKIAFPLLGLYHPYHTAFCCATTILAMFIQKYRHSTNVECSPLPWQRGLNYIWYMVYYYYYYIPYSIPYIYMMVYPLWVNKIVPGHDTFGSTFEQTLTRHKTKPTT